MYSSVGGAVNGEDEDPGISVRAERGGMQVDYAEGTEGSPSSTQNALEEMRTGSAEEGDVSKETENDDEENVLNEESRRTESDVALDKDVMDTTYGECRDGSDAVDKRNTRREQTTQSRKGKTPAKEAASEVWNQLSKKLTNERPQSFHKNAVERT